MWTWVACHDSAHDHVRMASAFNNWVPIDKHANSYTLWMSLSSKWQLSQQRHAAARSTVASRKNVKEAAIQLLSPVLGSVGVVAVADLGMVVLVAVVLVTVVLVVMFVLGIAAAGFTVGSVAGSAPGCPAAGPPTVSPVPPPDTPSPPVSPAGGVPTSGSITTCGATAPEASTTLPAPKVPPTGDTNRAYSSAPPAHATPLLAPGDFSR